MTMLRADDPEVRAFLTAWHEAGRASFERDYTSLVYDEYAPKTARERRKYLALDVGNEHTRSGVYLVDRVTGDVFTIKGYGIPNRRIGTLAGLTEELSKGVIRHAGDGAS